MPARFFGAVMGLGGLALVWQRAEMAGISPVPGIGLMALVVALMVSALVYLGYGLKTWRHRARVAADFRDPTRVTFIAGIPVSLMIFPAGILPLYPGMAPLLAGVWWAGLGLHYLLAAWMMRRWVLSPGLVREITPAWFVPTVGMIVAPSAGAALGLWTVSAVVLAVSALFWIVLLSFSVRRLIVSPLPAELLPSLFVLIAPPALVASGLGSLGIAPPMTAGFFFLAVGCLAIVIVMLFSRRADIRGSGFTLAWWGTTFPMAALAGAGIQYHVITLTAASNLMALGLLALATLVIAAVSILTVWTLTLRRWQHRMRRPAP